MRCLNTFSHRRRAAKILRIRCANLTFDDRPAARARLRRLLQRHPGVAVVKQFENDECHWVYFARTTDENMIRCYNTSTQYDMSNVENAIGKEWHRVRCAMQGRHDTYCQTWSLAAAVAHQTNKPLSKSLFRNVVRRLWKNPTFRACVRAERDHEMGASTGVAPAPGGAPRRVERT